MASTEGLMALKTVVRGEQESDESVQYRGGKSSTVTTATVLSCASERVWEVARVLVRACAIGEVKGRTRMTGRDDALARPVACPRTLWRAWASWAHRVPVAAVILLANGDVQRDQQSVERLKDMMMHARCERRKELAWW
jgi:hypothetical protein